ncbi:MAG: ribulose-phosphate 3-epimerase [Selenomonadaceae bacterium]|nr:ribulose-phosphate 3-epimerase [Selenomonadaceae bacterium]
MIKIAPSILSADFSKLREEIDTVSSAEYLHLDVMDGSFVPEITFGAGVVKSIRKFSRQIFDVHLMVEHPETQIDSFVAAGADLITFHIEATKHAHRLIQKIHASKIKAGVALNPATPLVMVEEILGDVDQVLIMTVNPGYGGQKFIDSQLDKIHRLREKFHCDIEVDGGINPETSKLVKESGANVLVAGSAIFNAKDRSKAIQSVRGN